MASPGDLGDERDAIRAIEDVVNHAFASSGIRIRVVGWELTTPGFGRPQARINPMVHQCDVFIGLLNRRWGSDTGEYSSGFEEEFEIALERRKTSDAPDIAMFFAKVPAELVADPGPQLSRVLEFKSRIQRDRTALYQEFAGPDGLSTLVLAFLTNQVLPLIVNATSEVGTQGSGGDLEGAAHAVESSGTETPGAGIAADPSERNLPPALQQLSETFSAFDALICGREPITQPDTDRLALVARSLERFSQPMGAHLVNRLYRNRNKLYLSAPERTLWLHTFLSDIGATSKAVNRTIPGWAILRPRNSSTKSIVGGILPFLMETEEAVVRGAIRLLIGLKLRPEALWPERKHPRPDGQGDDRIAPSSDEDLALVTWIGMFKSLPGVDATFDYMLQHAGDNDSNLLEELSCAEELDEASREAVLALIASRQGDYARLAALAPSNYSRDTDGLVALLANHIYELPRESLGRIAKFSKPSLRRLAIKRVLEEGDVGETIKDAFAWEDEETQRMLIRQVSTSTTLGEVILPVVAKDSGKYPGGLEANLLAAIRSPEELRAMYEASPFNYEAWHALGILSGQSMLEEARQTLDSDASTIRDRLRSVAHEYPELIPYIAQKYKAIACTIVGESGSKSLDDATRLAREVEQKQPGSVLPALQALEKVVSEDSLPIVDGILTTVEDLAVMRHLTDFFPGALADLLAKRWRRSEISDLRAASSQWLFSQRERTRDELIEGLYGEDAEARLVALNNLVGRLDRKQLRRLADSYPRRKREYWYNVVAAFDQCLFAPEDYVEDRGLTRE